MKIGMCVATDVKRLKCAAKYDFDYVETSFQNVARMTDEEFEEYAQLVKSLGVSCEAACATIPGTFSLTRDKDYDNLMLFLETGLKRCSSLGVKTIVLGSGKARGVEDDITFYDGIKALILFLKDYFVPLLKKYDVVLVIEPLCLRESNILNTVKEAAIVATAVDSEYVKVLADLYHMRMSGDDITNIYDVGNMIKHGHISFPFRVGEHKRIYPRTSGEYNYESFANALKTVGCERMSIEADIIDVEKDTLSGYNVIKNLK